MIRSTHQVGSYSVELQVFNEATDSWYLERFFLEPAVLEAQLAREWDAVAEVENKRSGRRVRVPLHVNPQLWRDSAVDAANLMANMAVDLALPLFRRAVRT